ncbi:Ferric-pseudobactin BN7/BN8 receptor [Achromobacter deleyi]|uniref:Ferric-pseudobactin BN7/BN8 receptor n=1 Tax=Achromobacter deleyi TaxID=1353891 RepID=A0A6S7A430_9BURK|nr:TonB-dependent receptor [Achromobacter deleyi]CAB3700709.1 Ferric-pseudobactin BN7/BN8 receptor [Achromobacter deleyi]CAB3850294.1 Ferric-pseudobactin BN7/BN8 receptor [Achromobacter deleyi]CAB3873079.1 Ferric-pseudobactin BN7/BN8 receptor [Achromobacter deleyi]
MLSLRFPVACVLAAAAGATQAQSLRHYDLPAGPLDITLTQVARVAGAVISFPAHLVTGKSAPPVSGQFTVEQATARALSGSGLELRRAQDGTLTIVLSNTATLAPVTVEASLGATTEGTHSYTTGSMATATKLALSPRETPQSVSVVTRQQIEDRGFQSLDDVARDVPGLTTRQIGGGERTQFFSRGFEISSFLADGVPLAYDYDTQGVATLAMYDRIEVLRGAAGMMTGAGNPSGTINLVRKRPTSLPQFSVTTSAGSWDNYRGEVDGGGALNQSGSVRARGVISYQDSNTFKKAYEHQRQLYYGTIEADITARTTLSIGGYYNREDSPGADWNGLPTRRDGSFYDFKRSTRLSPDWAYWNKENTSFFAELDHRFDSGWSGKVTARTLRARMNMLGSYLYPLEDSEYFGQRLGQYDYDKTQYSLDAYLSGPFTLLGRKHELVLGGSFLKNRDNDGPGGWPSAYDMTVDPESWNSSAVAKPQFDYPWSRKGYQRQVSGYATTRLSLADPLTLMLGARLDWYAYDMMLKSGDYVSPPAGYTVNHELTPYAGLIYDLDSHHSVYTSWTSVFQPQGSQSASGTPLAPVIGTNLEAGVKGEYFDGRLNASAAVFQIRQRNRPVALETSACAPGVIECYAPSGKVESRGFEVEVAGALTPGWQISAGYTFNRSKYLEASGSNPAGAPYDTQTPRHLFKLSTMYTLPGSLNAWRVGGAVRMQSAISLPAYHVRQAGYSIWDAVVAYRASPQLDLRLNVYNLFDKYYYQAIGSTQDNNHFGTPRSFLLTARYTF